MNSHTTSLPVLLDPKKLFFYRNELTAEDVSALVDLFTRPGDQQARADNVHFLLCLMHDCMGKDARRYLAEVFLPWTGLRRRVQESRDELDEDVSMVRLGLGDPRWMADVYRRIVADLFDPYITLATASFQFLEEKFVNIEAANIAMSERSKAEYLAARDGFSFLLKGYDASVRNAVSHAGSHGITSGKVSIVFKDIKRDSGRKARRVEWTYAELRVRIQALFECVLSIEAAENVFGLDCSSQIAEHVPLRLQFINEHYDAGQRANERSKMRAKMHAIVSEVGVSNEEVLRKLGDVLRYNYEGRGMPFLAAASVPAEKLVIFVPIPAEPFSSDGDRLNRIANLIRYSIIAGGVFGVTFPEFEVVELGEGEGASAPAVRLSVATSANLIFEYGEERAGLLDLEHSSRVHEAGVPLQVSIDFDALEQVENEMVGEPFPRVRR